MTHLDAAALTLVALAAVTTAVLIALHRLRHRSGVGGKGPRPDPCRTDALPPGWFSVQPALSLRRPPAGAGSGLRPVDRA